MYKCPCCQSVMNNNFYLKNRAETLDDYVIIEKMPNFKKRVHPLNVAVCPNCGYVFFYIENNHNE